MIEPDDELRARIHAWAREKRLDLDALEVAAYKLREPRSKMLRTLSDNDMFEAAFPASRSLPRQVLSTNEECCAACSADCIG